MSAFRFALVLLTSICLNIPATNAEELPTNESGAIKYLSAKGVDIKQNADGHAIRLMSSGKPPLTVAEYQLIGRLTHLEQMGLNAAPLNEKEWGFLKSLPKLQRLAIWHGKGFSTLSPFCGLPVESLTIGGCMGLRDLNKGNADKLRHAIKTLHTLPKLKSVNLYHSPLLPDDSHIAHLVKQFPTLEELKLDFAAPRGSQTTITPQGLSALQKLPLKSLSLENGHEFGEEHFTAIAGIKSLEVLLFDARRNSVPVAGLEAFRKLRPQVAVVVAKPGDARPPMKPRRKNPK